jgi:glyoxylase-like metal-dependent hydrolase (beta-lactamase superfamily II)
VSDVTPHPPATPEFGHVVRGGPAHRYPLDGSVQVAKFAVGEFDNNVYVVACDGTALIVDGAAEPERILGEVADLEVVGIVQTHNHPDHVQGLPALVRSLHVPVHAHPDDAMPVPTAPLTDGDVLRLGSAEVAVLHTPGHTPGSSCYRVGGFLFTGDTLFPGGPGNTMGNASRFAQIMESLDRLFELPDEVRVCPGHGLDTTIGRERPYVETWRARGW